jgi:hypothetical protein
MISRQNIIKINHSYIIDFRNFANIQYDVFEQNANNITDNLLNQLNKKHKKVNRIFDVSNNDEFEPVSRLKLNFKFIFYLYFFFLLMDSVDHDHSN